MKIRKQICVRCTHAPKGLIQLLLTREGLEAVCAVQDVYVHLHDQSPKPEDHRPTLSVMPAPCRRQPHQFISPSSLTLMVKFFSLSVKLGISEAVMMLQLKMHSVWSPLNIFWDFVTGQTWTRKPAYTQNDGILTMMASKQKHLNDSGALVVPWDCQYNRPSTAHNKYQSSQSISTKTRLQQ